jgi:predicted MFS family arabinose efflux permease
VPDSRAPRARGVDPIGQLLVIVVLGALTYAIIDAPTAGWGSAQTVGLFVLVAAALGGLLAYERRRTDPLVDVRFFRSVPFAGATVIAVCAFAAFSGFIFVSMLYLQDVRHLSALKAGLFIVPMAVVMVFAAPLSGRAVGARGPRPSLVTAGCAMTAGALMMTRLTDHTSYAWLACTFVVFAVGFGAVNAPITYTAVSGMPRQQAGVAAAFASTSRQVGGALGVAVVGSVINVAVGGSLVTSLAKASHPAWWIMAGCGIGVLLLGVATTGGWARASVERTAHLFAGEEPAAVSKPG